MLFYFWRMQDDLWLSPKEVTSISDHKTFKDAVIRTYEVQRVQCDTYKRFCDLVQSPANVSELAEIPYLPIDLFRKHQVILNGSSPEAIFQSSGTTGQTTSKHHVANLEFYHESLDAGFKHFYGREQDYAVLALLPHYLERKNSSLVYMAQRWIDKSKDQRSGFYLNDLDRLINNLIELATDKRPVILLGVTFALIDLASKLKGDFPHLTIIETGGMKGMRREMIREELHQILKASFRESEIHSEYGMTELLSQAYLQNGKTFSTPPWMKVSIRDTNDPLSWSDTGKTGGVNIIDLANQLSCSFIATQDLGRMHGDGTFELMGRFDQSEVRGCNLMVTQG